MLVYDYWVPIQPETPENTILRRGSGFLKASAKKALLLTVGLVGACVIAEIALRIFLPTPAQWRIQPANSPMKDGARVSVVIPAHPSQGGLFEIRGIHKRLRANVDAVIANHTLSGIPVRISTNSLGLRHREIGTKKSKRILFLGDSITLADYLPDELTFVRLVEESAAKDAQNWECINAGVGAVGLNSEVALYFEIQERLDPDVVVLNLYLNDFSDSVAWLDPLPRVLHNSYLITYSTTIVMQVYTLLTDDDLTADRLDGWRQELKEKITAVPTFLEKSAVTKMFSTKYRDF